MTGVRRFDARQAGTAAADWAPAIAELPFGGAIGPHDHLLVLVAHPDDETLGAGGLIADAAAAGAEVTVVIASDGEGSHPDSPTHSPGRLADRRRGEAVAAIGRLASTARLVQLGLPDGRLTCADVSARLTGLALDVTVVAATWREDGHPDHVVCGQVAAEFCARRSTRLLEFPIWGWHWGRPGVDGPLVGGSWVRRPVRTRAQASKAAALAEYRSQLFPLSPAEGDERVVGPELVDHARRGVEVFAATDSPDLPAAYFERLYANSSDPWRTADRFYERRKRALLLASLPRDHFGWAFEPGCGTGLLTAALAERCDHLLATDASEQAVQLTMQRVTTLPNVEVTVGSVPTNWPNGELDLIVLSELGYYLADPSALARRVRTSLSATGVLVACHWQHPAPGYPSTAEDVHATLGTGLHRLVHHVEDDFILDVWSPDPRSVARLDGILGP